MTFRVGENFWSVRMFQKDSPSTQKDIGSDIKVNNECLLKGLEIARDKWLQIYNIPSIHSHGNLIQSMSLVYLHEKYRKQLGNGPILLMQV